VNASNCTPSISDVRGLSAEDAYFVLGFQQGGGVVPWIDSTQLYLPGATTSEQQLLAEFVNVPANQMAGVDESANGGDTAVFAAMTAQSEALSMQALGVMGTDYYDQHRSDQTVAALAFRAYQQWKAYYPDVNSYPNAASTSFSNTFEKQNIRDGHYVMWGYLHAISREPAAQKYGAFLQGTGSYGAYTPFQAAIDTHLVPQCAMQVQRTHLDGEELSSYSDPDPCGCAYSALAHPPESTTTCAQCGTGLPPCSSGTCHHGYCESQ
jgi:hypothetical protein